MNKKIHAFFLILLFLLPMSFVLNAKQLEVKNIPKLSNPIDESTTLTGVIFFETRQEVNLFVQKNPHSTPLPLLMAAIVNYAPHDLSTLLNTYGKDFYDLTNSTFKTRFDDLPILGDQMGIQSTTSISTINADQLHSLGYKGDGVKVGVMDTGVDKNHPDLAGRVVAQKSFVDPKYGYSGTEDVGDTHGHGTFVAGVIAGNGTYDSQYIGVAPKALIVDAKVGGLDPQQPEISTVAMIVALEWLLEQGVDVINISIGSADVARPGALSEALERAVEHNNVVIAIAAGNEGPGDFTVGSPSTTDGVISVAASMLDGSGIASFSSRGLSARFTYKPDISAPGVQIVAPRASGTTMGDVVNDKYVRSQGTSFAAPHVAGAAALLVEVARDNSFTVHAGSIKAAMMATAVPMAGYSAKDQGAGLLDVYAAYQKLTSAPKTASNVPKITAVNPNKMPFDFLPYILKDAVYTEYLSVVSTIPGDVVLGLEGNISSILSLGTVNTSLNTSIVPVNFAPDPADADGIYVGNITVSDGIDQFKISVNVRVNGTARARVLLDLWHTPYNIDAIFGSNIMNSFFLLFYEGIFVEQGVQEITSSLLANYDVLWIPDPAEIGIGYDEVNDQTTLVTMYPFTTNEISAITNFVETGGSLFVDFLGPVSSNGITVGTDVTELNELIGNFGITASNEFVNGKLLESPESATPLNVTPITKGVDEFTHAGGYLSVTDPAFTVGKHDDKPMMAANDLAGAGGRVVVTSTNFWMDNNGITNRYTSGTNNDVLLINTFNWLLSSDQIDVQYVYENDEVTFTIHATVDGTNISDSNELDALELSSGSSLTLTGTNGVFEATYTITSENVYEFYFGFKNSVDEQLDYRIVRIVKDTTPPTITFNIENGTTISETTQINITFEDVQTLTPSYINITIDGKKTTFTFSVDEQKATVSINPENMEGGEHVLEVAAMDPSGNLATASVTFNIGGGGIPFADLNTIIFAVLLTSIIVVYKKRNKH